MKDSIETKLIDEIISRLEEEGIVISFNEIETIIEVLNTMNKNNQSPKDHIDFYDYI